MRIRPTDRNGTDVSALDALCLLGAARTPTALHTPLEQPENKGQQEPANTARRLEKCRNNMDFPKVAYCGNPRNQERVLLEADKKCEYKKNHADQTPELFEPLPEKAKATVFDSWVVGIG